MCPCLTQYRHQGSEPTGSPADSHSSPPPSSPRPIQSPPTRPPQCSVPWPSCCLHRSDLHVPSKQYNIISGKKKGHPEPRKYLSSQWSTIRKGFVDSNSRIIFFLRYRIFRYPPFNVLENSNMCTKTYIFTRLFCVTFIYELPRALHTSTVAIHKI